MLGFVAVMSLLASSQFGAGEMKETSESIGGGISVALTVRCKEQYGPEVFISLENVSENEMEFPAENLPWNGSVGNISFATADRDMEIVNWVGGHNYAKVKLGKGESISGVTPLWDRVEPPSVRGVRTLEWKYGKLHNGHLRVDFTACPVKWRYQDNPRRAS